MSVIEKAIEKISSLGLEELLLYITFAKLSGESLEYAKKRIKDFWANKQYGFTPSKEEAVILYKIGKREIFKRLKECIGKHPALNIIRVGIRISELNEEGKRREEVEKLREDVYAKYGTKGIRILNMGSTGIITQVIEYLSFIKIRDNLTQMDVSIEFDKILENWEQITIFVKSEDKKEEIYSKLKSFVERRLHVFFVFAFGSASPIAMQAVAELHNNKITSKEGYLFFVIPKTNLVGTEIYTWSFELIQRINESNLKPF